MKKSKEKSGRAIRRARELIQSQTEVNMMERVTNTRGINEGALDLVSRDGGSIGKAVRLSDWARILSEMKRKEKSYWGGKKKGASDGLWMGYDITCSMKGEDGNEKEKRGEKKTTSRNETRMGVRNVVKSEPNSTCKGKWSLPKNQMKGDEGYPYTNLREGEMLLVARKLFVGVGGKGQKRGVRRQLELEKLEGYEPIRNRKRIWGKG